MAAAALQQLLDPRKGRSLMQINTALQRMGFSTWTDLEPEDQRSSDDFVRQRLNERLFETIQKIELKRMKAEKEEAKKIGKMSKEDKRKFELKQQKDALNERGRRGKGKVTPQDEERAVHESYQILLLEYQAKKLTREKKSRERLKSNELKAKLEAEAAALQAEQDKIKTDMDKFFDSSGSVSRLSAPTSSSKRRGSTANLGDGTGSPSLNRTRSVNVGSMMRTNTALLRFKKSSKSFKTRKDKETVAEVEEVGDVNWTMD